MIRFRSRVNKESKPLQFGEWRMENRGKGRPSGLPSIVGSQYALQPTSEEYCFDQVNPGPPFRTGGNFFLTRKSFPRTKQGDVYIVGPRITDPPTLGFVPTAEESWHYTYKGGFGDPQIPGGLPALPAMSFVPSGLDSGFDPNVNPNDMGSLGNRAWAKLRPDPARGGLAQAVLELRDFPKMLQTSSKSFHLAWSSWRRTIMQSESVNRELVRDYVKQVPDEFLNNQFGWAPFLGDLANTMDVIQNFADYEARELERNGRWRNRKKREEATVSDQLVYQLNSNSAGTYASPSLFSPNRWLNLRDPEGTHAKGRPDHISVHRQSVVEVWYEGKFRSYYPEFDKGLKSGYPALDSARRAMRMHGLSISPTLLWNITPWSWMVDWFAGVGDAIQRYEDMLSDTVAAQYFYLMRRIVSRYEYTITKQTYQGPIVLKWHEGVETKRRAVGANSFGFSGSPTGLSGRQQAILGALGIANRPR